MYNSENLRNSQEGTSPGHIGREGRATWLTTPGPERPAGGVRPEEVPSFCAPREAGAPQSDSKSGILPPTGGPGGDSPSLARGELRPSLDTLYNKSALSTDAGLRGGFDRLGVEGPQLPLQEHPFITIYCAAQGHKQTVKISCGHRSCPECSFKAGKRLVKIFSPLLQKSNLVHLVLTVRNTHTLTRARIKNLRACFQRLLHQEFYREVITGGIYVFHVTNKGRGWHIHIHAVVKVTMFIPQDRLARDWRRATGGWGQIAYIRKIKAGRAAKASFLNYMFRDLLKGPDIRREDAALYDEVFKGTRMAQGFGELYRLKFQWPKFPCPVCGCTEWITEFEITRAYRGEGRSPPITPWLKEKLGCLLD